MKIFIVVVVLVVMSIQGFTQRMRHGGGSRSFNRMGNNQTINGGSYNSRNRSSNPSVGQTPSSSPRANINSNDRSYNYKPKAGTRESAGTRETNRANQPGQRDVNRAATRDIDRNTIVRNNDINIYHRPPYHYGGHRYYCHHPYYYHPYHAYYWGPAYNPWGVFVAAVAVTAIVIYIENQKYYYDQGVWYTQSSSGYTVVSAPVGGTVTTIPDGAQTVQVNNVTNYYYGGSYYEKSGEQYKVVPPPAGAVVENLPEGGEEVRIGDQTYVKIGETYYQPVQVDGKPKYEVVQVEAVTEESK